jgi:hypothetical protein
MNHDNVLKIEERKYYKGFGVAMEKKLFAEELENLEICYDTMIESAKENLSQITPNLIDLMKEFINEHEKMYDVMDKLDVLKEKLSGSHGRYGNDKIPS